MERSLGGLSGSGRDLICPASSEATPSRGRLSLADNAARASEAAQIEEFLADGGKTAICLLNQKDKLSKDELERLKNHAQTTYGRFFERIIAVSAKQAVTAQANGDEALLTESNFGAVISAIRNYQYGRNPVWVPVE